MRSISRKNIYKTCFTKWKSKKAKWLQVHENFLSINMYKERSVMVKILSCVVCAYQTSSDITTPHQGAVTMLTLATLQCHSSLSSTIRKAPAMYCNQPIIWHHQQTLPSVFLSLLFPPPSPIDNPLLIILPSISCSVTSIVLHNNGDQFLGGTLQF